MSFDKVSGKSDGRKEQQPIPEACGLALGRLASASTTVVGAVLAILRGRWLVVDHVPSDPDLVRVTIAAIPDLNLRPEKVNSGRYKERNTSHTRLLPAWLPSVRSRHLPSSRLCYHAKYLGD